MQGFCTILPVYLAHFSRSHDRITRPCNLFALFQQALNSVEKANIYAEAGLWYNALDEVFKLAPASKQGEMGSTLLKDLAVSEAPKTTSQLSPKERDARAKQIETLKQIADSAR